MTRLIERIESQSIGKPRSRRWIVPVVGLMLGLIAVIVMLIGVDVGENPEYALFIGRFHPLLVHLPIGFLLAAGLLEVFARRPALAHLRTAVPFLLGLGAIGAILSVGTGLFLSTGGGYEEEALGWHKRLGISVALLVVLTFFIRLMADRQGSRVFYLRAYVVCLAGTVGLVAITGHLGGSLTHGAGYLTLYMPGPLRTMIPFGGGDGRPVMAAHFEEATIYGHLIQPILEKRCVSCHGEQKQKGDLRLDTPEFIRAGGENGSPIVEGDAPASELFHRVILPPGHEDRMPPKGKPPLTLEEIELLRWWIDGGASFDQKIVDLEAPPSIELVLDWRFGSREDRPTGIFALDIPAPDTAVLDEARRLGLSVRPLADGVSFVDVNAINTPDTFGDAQLQALVPLAPQVAWLDLSETRVTDAGAATLAKLEHLTRLHLEKTGIGDGGLAALKNLKYLEYLNLYGTGVTDAGLVHLAAMPELQRLYLWQTKTSPEGIRKLREQRPDLDVNSGIDVPAAGETSGPVPVAAGK